MNTTQPESKTRQLNEGVAIATVVITLVVTGWMTFENFRRLEKDRLKVRHTHEVILAIDEIEFSMIDAETGQRGYILTGQSRDLKPYEKAIADVDRRFNAFAALIRDNEQQQQQAAKLRPLIGKRLDELDTAVQMRRDNGLEVAIESVDTDIASKTMDDVRAVLDQIRRNEFELLDVREAIAERSYAIGLATVLLSTFTGLVLVIGVMYLIHHNRHRAEKAADAIFAERERLRLAAETTGFGTYDVDAQTRQKVWSGQLFDILGLDRDVIPTDDLLLRRVHPDDHHDFEKMYWAAFEPDPPENHHLQFRVVRSDGSVRWVSNSGRVFCRERDGHRIPIRIIGTMQDVTDQKRFENSLQEARLNAEAANRSRGEFLANMSHEIRTPMAAILGHADILNDHLKNPDNLQVVDTIRRNGNFLLSIINDILDLSKIDAGKLEIEKERVRPDGLIAEVRSLMDVRAAEKNVSLMIEFDGRVPGLIQTDAVRVRQVLLNLIGNAIKFTDNGEVRLTVHYEQDSERMIFEIIDTGIGIKPEDQRMLFEPFKQADNTSTRTFGGTGLGLAICRRLAHAMGGDVSVDSEYGKGSTFTLSIEAAACGPLIEPDLSLQKPTEGPAPLIQLSVNVLVVDDRRDIRYLAQHFIEKAGGSVVTATNGQEAIDYIASPHSPPVDVIVMDMQMPVMDGYDAATELRRRGCELPIIALTANAMKSDRDECLAAGCTDYTTKPLDSQRLIAMIHQLTSVET